MSKQPTPADKIRDITKLTQERSDILTAQLERSLAIEELCALRNITCDWDKYEKISSRWHWKDQRFTFRLYMNGTEVASFLPEELPPSLLATQPPAPLTHNRNRRF